MTDDERFDKFVDWFKGKMKEHPENFDMISQGTYFHYQISYPKGFVNFIKSDFGNERLIKILLNRALRRLHDG